MPKYRYCVICGKKFDPPRYKDGHISLRITCGKKCRYELTAQKTRQRKMVKCSNCGRTLERIPYFIKKFEHQFCDKRCHGDWLAVRMGEANNPNWRGGYAPYYGPNWIEQRQKAWERDDYTCQGCGATPRGLGQNPDAHHLVPFAEFGPERYLEANALDNLVCLCRSCHGQREYA